MRFFANGWKGFVLMAWLPVALSAPTAMEASTMWMTVGEHRFAIALEDNPSTRQLLTRLPLSLDMTDLHGNEKYATVQPPLPTQPYRPGTTTAAISFCMATIRWWSSTKPSIRPTAIRVLVASTGRRTWPKSWGVAMCG